MTKTAKTCLPEKRCNKKMNYKAHYFTKKKFLPVSVFYGKFKIAFYHLFVIWDV